VHESFTKATWIRVFRKQFGLLLFPSFQITSKINLGPTYPSSSRGTGGAPPGPPPPQVRVPLEVSSLHPLSCRLHRQSQWQLFFTDWTMLQFRSCLILFVLFQNDWVPPPSFDELPVNLIVSLSFSFCQLIFFVLKGEPNESELFIKIRRGPISPSQNQKRAGY
jgi:hypothetical protein